MERLQIRVGGGGKLGQVSFVSSLVQRHYRVLFQLAYRRKQIFPCCIVCNCVRPTVRASIVVSQAEFGVLSSYCRSKSYNLNYTQTILHCLCISYNVNMTPIFNPSNFSRTSFTISLLYKQGKRTMKKSLI